MTDEVIAFPHNPHTDVEGMTLRDYFAAAAFQGLLANQGPQPGILKAAWAWADHMLKLRSENHS